MSSNDQPRKPKGQPVGGQFDAKAQSDDDLGALGAEFPEYTRGTGDNDRASRIVAGEYVAPVLAEAVGGTTVGPSRTEWFNQHLVIGEHNTGASFPRMGDDRNRQRRTYKGAGVTLTMMSARSIRAFEAECKGTFEVPYSALDERSGKTIAGHVQVTKTGPGQWSVQAPGAAGATAAKVSEAVASVLEARSVTMALRTAGDLIEKHNERVLAQGSMAKTVGSSWIDRVGELPEGGVMTMKTLRGDLYGFDVHQNPGVIEAMRTTDAPGKVFNAQVKGRYDRVSVDECGTCGRVYASERGHTCGFTRVGSVPTRARVVNREAVDLAARELDRRRGA